MGSCSLEPVQVGGGGCPSFLGAQNPWRGDAGGMRGVWISLERPVSLLPQGKRGKMGQQPPRGPWGHKVGGFVRLPCPPGSLGVLPPA